ECNDLVRTNSPDRLVEFAREPLAVLLRRLAGGAIAVLVAGRHMLDIHEQRRELGPAPGVAAHRERTEGVAVVTLAAGDEAAALRLADLHEILASHLERGLHGLRATRHEICMAGACRRPPDQVVRKFLGHVRCEEAGMRVGELAELLAHRLEHVRMAVAEARDRRAAGGIDVVPTLAVAQVDALARDRCRVAAREVAVEDCGHRVLLVYLLVAVAGSTYTCSASRCPCTVRSRPRTASPPSVAIACSRVSASASAPVMDWKYEGVSVWASNTRCAGLAMGESGLSVIATSAMPRPAALRATSRARRA